MPHGRWQWRDVGWIVLAVGLLIAVGFGLRDPWPADEPRFASLARDMVASGDWLFPRVGGDLYQDKPPLYFWLLAASYGLIGTVRWSFLLPSLLASIATLLLVYDLARRLHGRQAALAASLTLACTLQFMLVHRGAQIDAVLCALMTLSFYALLRHLLLGPAWRWYAVGGLAAGFGVITKGVGFLPLLSLLVYLPLQRRRWEGLTQIHAGGWRWWLAPLGFVAGVGVWLLPMLATVAAQSRPELVAYRDEILFQQTVQRYAASWHHVKAWYFYLVEVIPLLWLPFSALLIWLLPRWRAAWREHDARVWLPLGWCALVLLFFSVSPGKRGVYVHPLLPALAIAAAPYLGELLVHIRVRRAGLALAALLPLAAGAFLCANALGVAAARAVAEEVGPRALVVATIYVAGAALIWAWAAWRRSVLAWPATLAMLAACWGAGIAPQINAARSGSGFVAAVLTKVPADQTLALVSYKEQFLLYLDRETVNFGHRRWLEGDQEAFDAASWLAVSPSERVLLIPEAYLPRCFGSSQARRELAGETSRNRWWLVRGMPDAQCVARGDPGRAIRYPAHQIG